MAKGSAMGLWRGKKGSTVFYKIKNSNSAQKQGMRERVYEVSNPKTYGQASQRMKLAPAQRIASALKPIIERSFEGIAYGDASRRYFLKRALSLSIEQFPAVSKNENLLIPVPFEISRGSLPAVTINRFVEDQTETSLSISAGLYTTIGQLSAGLLAQNPNLKTGQQITLVAFVATLINDEAVLDSIKCQFTSFYLDVNDVTDIQTSNLEGFTFVTEQGLLSFYYADVNDYVPVAAAVIISEDSPTPLRSSATLTINTQWLGDFFTPIARRRARQSFMKAAAASVDWPVENVTTVNVKAEPTAGGTVSGAGNHIIGELVSIVATPATGYVFDGWFKDNQLVSNDATYTFEATEAAGGLYVAHFAENS